MLPFILSLGWGLLVFLAFIGWGSLLGLVTGNRGLFDWGHRAALGMALLVVLGGVLNLLHVISPGLCIAIVVAGAVTAANEIRLKVPLIASLSARIIEIFRKDLYTSLICLALLIAIALVGSFRFMGHGWETWSYNGHDDLHAYLVFPQKMLQTGTIGDDPFSQRRVETGLGGQSFLHALILAGSGNESLDTLDPGIALLILAGIFIGIGRRFKIPPAPIFLLILAAYCAPYPKVNTTSLVTCVALMVCFLELGLQGILPNPKLKQPLLITSLLIAGLCSLKNSFVPTVILFVLISALGTSILQPKIRRRMLHDTLLLILLSSAFLLPWMISLYQSSGTLYFPILGKGFHGSRYGNLIFNPYHWWDVEYLSVTLKGVFAQFWAIGLVFIIVVSTKAGTITRQNAPALLGLLIASLAQATVLDFSTIGEHRYSFPSGYAAFLILMLWALSVKARARVNPFSVTTTVAFCIFFAGPVIRFQELANYKGVLLGNISDAISGRRLHTPAETAQYQHLLDSVPEGAIVLTRLDRPYLLNFHRNTIWLADYPGGASLPPGLPYRKGPQALADYLLSAGIRYIAYSYANSANFGDDFKSRLEPGQSPWFRSSAELTYDFQDNLVLLGRSRLRLYDDGKNFVLDLLGKR